MKSRRRFLATTLGVCAVGPFISVSAQTGPQGGAVMTKEQRDRMTPDQVLDALTEGNVRFRSGKMVPRDYLTERRLSAEGQFPAAVILGCVDSRVPGEIVFDAGIGDMFDARIAGNVVNDDQWPGSRVISAQKANTANAFSLPGLALSTANLFTATQPGNSLYGLQHSNPVNPAVAYGGSPAVVESVKDPMVGKKIGGVNVFGGGLAVYNAAGKIVGGIGVSGDSSCADHNIAWKVAPRDRTGQCPGWRQFDGRRQHVNDIVNGKSASGWGHHAGSGRGRQGTAPGPSGAQEGLTISGTLEPAIGLEPMTCRLRIGCSTN